MKATVKFENERNVSAEMLSSTAITDLTGIDVVLTDGRVIKVKVNFDTVEVENDFTTRNVIIDNSSTVGDVHVLMLKGEKGDKGDPGQSGVDIVRFDTTANWNAQRSLIAAEGVVYVYTDYERIDQVDIPAIKVGDGTSYLIDMPFVSGNKTALQNHIEDTNIHVTAEERLFWNNKVTCFLSSGQEETLVFTKGE